MAKDEQAVIDAAIDEREGPNAPPDALAATADPAGALGLTEAMLLTPAAPPELDKPAGADHPEADPPAEKQPDKEPEPADKPDETPAEKPEAPADKDDEPKGGEWDKGRQAQSQELANMRKQMGELVQVVQDLGQKLPTPKAEEPEVLDELDEDAGPDEQNAAINSLIRRGKLVQQREQTAETVADLDKEQVANKQAFDDLLDAADTKFGKEHRNEAVTRLQAFWTEQGFEPGQFPDAASTAAAIRGIYAEVKAEAVVKAAQEKKPALPPKKLRDDSGRSGSPAATPRMGNETLDEAEARMTREGKFG